MTNAELREKIKNIGPYTPPEIFSVPKNLTLGHALSEEDLDAILSAVQEYVSEIIGEDEMSGVPYMTKTLEKDADYWVKIRNEFRDEIRKKAGL